MHCSRRLVVQTLVFSRSGLHSQVSPPETLVVKGGTTWARKADEFCLKMPDFHVTFRDLLQALNLRHGTNDFTSLPKDDVLRIFSPWKIRQLPPGLNPRTWVPKASTLPQLETIIILIRRRTTKLLIQMNGDSTRTLMLPEREEVTGSKWKLRNCGIFILYYSPNLSKQPNDDGWNGRGRGDIRRGVQVRKYEGRRPCIRPKLVGGKTL